MSDDYRRDLVDNDGFPLPPILTTDAAQRRVKARDQATKSAVGQVLTEPQEGQQ